MVAQSDLIYFLVYVSFHVFNSNLSLSSMLSGFVDVLNSGIGQFPFSSVLERTKDQHPRSLRALWTKHHWNWVRPVPFPSPHVISIYKGSHCQRLDKHISCLLILSEKIILLCFYWVVHKKARSLFLLMSWRSTKKTNYLPSNLQTIVVPKTWLIIKHDHDSNFTDQNYKDRGW